MQKKLPRDANSLAARIVAMSTGQEPPKFSPDSNQDTTAEPVKEKNPAAVALGRLGGLKGGRARAETLSDLERRRIAIKAAQARWGKR